MPKTIVTRTYRPTNHTAHVIACVLTSGLWIPGYVICHRINKRRAVAVRTTTIYDDAEFAPHADHYGGIPGGVDDSGSGPYR
jgi:hypothetical protein